MANLENGMRIAVETSFLLLIFSLGFMQPNFEFGGMSLPISDLLFLVTGTLWLIAFAFSNVKFRFDPVFVLLGLYAAGLLFSASLSENSSISLIKYLGQLYLIGLAVLTFQIVRTAEMLKKVILIWLAASAIVGVAGMMAVASFYFGFSNSLTEFLFHNYGTLPAGNYPRIQSTFLYPSMLCNYLTVSIMMLFAAFRLKWVSNIIFVGFAVMFAITAAFTITPGLGGAFLAVSMWFWLICKESSRPGLGKLILSGGIFAIIVFLVVSAFSILTPHASEPFLVFSGIPIAPAVRLLTWQDAFQTFLTNPVFGKGLGLAVANVVFSTPSTGQMRLLADAHNTFLNVAGQAGIVGLLPLLMICIAVVRRSLPFTFTSNDSSTVKLALGIAFVSAFICQGLVGSFEDARHLWVLIGLIMAASKFEGSGTGGGQ